MKVSHTDYAKSVCYLLLFLVVHDLLEKRGELVHAHRAEVAVRAVARGNPLTVQELTLRASEQVTDQGTGGIKFQGLRVVFRGRPVSFKPGTMKQGQKMGASVTLELVYVLIEINGKVELELDKLNDKYIVNGVDILEEVRKYC